MVLRAYALVFLLATACQHNAASERAPAPEVVASETTVTQRMVETEQTVTTRTGSPGTVVPAIAKASPAMVQRGARGQAIFERAKAIPAQFMVTGRSEVLIRRADGRACERENLGKCGCLPPEFREKGRSKEIIWDDSDTYDIACCWKEGSEFTLHTCGKELSCNDAGGAITCQRQ